MCGINGFSWPDKEAIESMNDILKHRGPDGEGTFVDELVSLGHRRLAIIDLSERGKQPMCNEDGSLWLIQDGEIYNFKELRKELEQKGHHFKSNTDAEVILHAYEEWQFECLDRFNGMFAFALYDSKRKKLFLARDRFGIKPLYYYDVNGRFIFSSEIKGILCHPVERKPNDGIVFDFLCFTLMHHRSETFFQNIFQLPPASYLVYDLEDRSLSVKQWYKLQASSLNIANTDNGQKAEAVNALLKDSVRLRLTADVPVGSCVSGGLDSSSIVCLERELMPEIEIKAFTTIFPGTALDESYYLSEVVKFAGLESYTVAPTGESLMDDLNDLIITQEEPYPGTTVYAQYKAMKLAHEQGMKVLLDGQGGDELIAGYIDYFGFYFYELLRKLRWYRLLREAFYYLKSYRQLLPFQLLALSLLPEMTRKRVWNKRTKWISRQLYNTFEGDGISGDRRWLTKSLNEALLNDLLNYRIPHLIMWGDKNSMRWGIEDRLPFLDHRLVEMVTSFPPEDKLRDGVTRYIFRQAMTGTLPEKIRLRIPKTCFVTPSGKWLRQPKFLEFAGDLIASASFKERPYWEYQQVTGIFNSYRNGIGASDISDVNTGAIWKWINLELWLRQFIDK